MSHDERRVKNVLRKTPPSDQRGIIISDGARLRVEGIGNIDVLFHGRSEERITLCDVSYVPDLKFVLFSFHKAQQTHVTILDAAGDHIIEKKILSLARRVDRTCERPCLRPVL